MSYEAENKVLIFPDYPEATEHVGILIKWAGISSSTRVLAWQLRKYNTQHFKLPLTSPALKAALYKIYPL